MDVWLPPDLASWALKYSPSQPRDTHGRWTGGAWTPLSSVPQIDIALMAAHPFCTFDLTGSTVENANEVAQAVEDFASEYPEAFKLVPYIGTGQGRDGNQKVKRYFEKPGNGAVDAVTFTSSSEIGLNPKMMRSPDADALLHVGEDTGWSVPGSGSVRGALMHEFGHVVEAELLNAGDTPSPWHKGKTVTQEVAFLNAQWGDEGLSLSGYARSYYERQHSYDETFAESFAALHYSPQEFQFTHDFCMAQQVLLEHLAHGQVPLKTARRSV